LPAKLSPLASFKSDRVTLEELAACADNGIKNIKADRNRPAINFQYFIVLRK
jgi:hypothetical protein